MAIPGTPQNFYVQSANQQILASWDLSAGATSYIVQRSLDNVTFTTIATVTGSPLATQYLDTSALLGVAYWYQVAASSVGGTSPYTISQQAVAAPTGEKTLGQLRLAAMQRADRVNSNFVTKPEWDDYLNQAMYELYDILITVYEDLYVASPIQFQTNGSSFLYPLPNGSNTFQNALNLSQTVTPPAFYKLLGLDLAIQSSSNGYVTLSKFNFIDRNSYVYPNSSSTLYGVFNMRYRVIGNNIEFIPTPTAAQSIRMWYIPRLPALLLDTDTTTVGISGWTEWIIVKAAYYALTKEESDTTSLVMQLVALQKRIEETAANRDAGQPDTISDTRRVIGSGQGGGSTGWGGNFGGY